MAEQHNIKFAMNIEELAPEVLWRHYQRGYLCLVRNGLYFRQLLRPALSHVYFLRAMPLLRDYARANRDNEDLPVSFGDDMEKCPLTPRDLLHLDYAICLGYAEAQGNDPTILSLLPVMDWPGPAGRSGIFIAVDAMAGSEPEELLEYDDMDDEDDDFPDEDEGSKPPFDL